ncbi:MAG: hypothetical protein WBG01_18385 [Bacteroidota bacterium]
MKTSVLLTLFILAIGTAAALAEVPKTISYQGVLGDGSGNPSTDTSAALTFRLYDTGSGGTAIWEETQSVLFSNGLFTAILGSTAPLGLPFDSQYWLGISVNGGSELSPRTPLTSSPYSLKAGDVDSGKVVKSINGLRDDVVLAGGSNVTVSSAGDTLIISATGGGGSLTLPFSGATQSSSSALAVTNTGTGAAATFLRPSLDTTVATVQVLAGGGGGILVTNIADSLSPSRSARGGPSVVVSNSPLVDVRRSGSGTGLRVSSEFISNLPTGRNYSSFLVQTPGVQTEPAAGIQHEGTGNAFWVRGTNSSNEATGIDYEYNGIGVGSSYRYTNKLSATVGFQYDYSGSGTGMDLKYTNLDATGHGFSLGYSGLGRGFYLNYGNTLSTEPGFLLAYSGAGSALSVKGFNPTSTEILFNLEAQHVGRAFGLNQTGTGRGLEVQINNQMSNETAGLFYSTGLGTNFYAYTAREANPNPAGWFNHSSSNGIGVLGQGATAGLFHGNVDVQGSLSKSSGTFKIDHPLDPANKYLYHSFVESPDMMNIYNGNTSLDGSGEGWVELPEWFGALNDDFRYQLTCVGGYAPVYVADKVQNNRFGIAGGAPGLEVSWQVTGIRKDPYAAQHRVRVEVEKPMGERGKYLHPDVYGLPASMGIRSLWEEKAARLTESLKNEKEQ